jgi:hypothetical protein
MLVDFLATLMCVACGLLLIAGVQKLRDSASTLAAARSVGIPASIGIVRTLAVGELAVASYWLISSKSLGAWAVSGVYAMFALFALLAIRRLGKKADCGCFGQQASPLAWPHVAFNVCVAGAAALAAVTPDVSGPATLLSGAVLEQALGVMGLMAATYFAYALLTVGAQLRTQFQGMEAE